MIDVLATTDFTGIGLMFGAICAGLATVIGAIRTASAVKDITPKLAEVAVKQDKAVVKAEETHILVNSNLQAVRQQLMAAIACVVALLAFIVWNARELERRY